jgi:tetratricopeptide (TPR) repeat protein
VCGTLSKPVATSYAVPWILSPAGRCIGLASGVGIARFLAGALAAVLGLWTVPSAAQQTVQPPSDGITIHGVVLDAVGKPVSGALVHLQREGAAAGRDAKADAEGRFSFPGLEAGTYDASAATPDSSGRAPVVTVSPTQAHPIIDIVLKISANGGIASGNSTSSLAGAMEFADKPDFVVAGVTDWTAAGGHGSDVSLRTSEALTRETVALKPGKSENKALDAAPAGAPSDASESALRAAVAHAPEDFAANRRMGQFYLRQKSYAKSIPYLQACYRINPEDLEIAKDLVVTLRETGDSPGSLALVEQLLRSNDDDADLHRLAGELDEKLGDPLTAVHELEQAVHKDPSEPNYFQWGSELLLHRAVWQAQEVFRQGAEAYPKSSRMLTALGASQFAGALYDRAALSLCRASDLDPSVPQPYLFMGKILLTAPNPLPCVEAKLARFAEIQPRNPLAIYYHAMATWRHLGSQSDPQTLSRVESMLQSAVTIDPKCSEAYLQLGILSYLQKEYDAAIGYYRKAIGANPQLSDAHYRLAVAYDRAGDRANASAEFALHDQLEKAQAAEVERQRREVKQFLVVDPPQAVAPQQR